MDKKSIKASLVRTNFKVIWKKYKKLKLFNKLKHDIPQYYVQQQKLIRKKIKYTFQLRVRKN